MNNKNNKLICCFAISFHNKNNKYKILNDNISGVILGNDYDKIKSYLINNVKYFNNDKLTSEDKLRWIVDKELSPAVLGCSIFFEKSLLNSIRFGCKQYLIYGSGYDTYSYRNKVKGLKIFEIDDSYIIDDKINRLELNNIDYSDINYIKCDLCEEKLNKYILKSTYDKNTISFNNLNGLSYYLTKNEFSNFIKNISSIICYGSSIVFDYNNNYSFKEIENLLLDNNLYIYEHLNYNDMNNTFFYKYNTLNPDNKIIVSKDIYYCLAVKK